MLTALATPFYVKMLCIHFGELLHDISYLRYASGICIALEAVLLKLHVKLAPGWVFIRVNFDPIQEIGPKVGGGRSFVSGPFFARLRYLVQICDPALHANIEFELESILAIQVGFQLPPCHRVLVL